VFGFLVGEGGVLFKPGLGCPLTQHREDRLADLVGRTSTRVNLDIGEEGADGSPRGVVSGQGRDSGWSAADPDRLFATLDG
jgi:hypothetical protein